MTTVSDSDNPSLYDLLGVKSDASEEELKTAYRKKSMELHPDRNTDDPTAQERFQAMKAAYETLSNPQKRAEYDATGEVTDQPDLDEIAEEALAAFFLNACEAITQNSLNASVAVGRNSPVSILIARLADQERGILKRQDENVLMVERFRQILRRLRRKGGKSAEDTRLAAVLHERITRLHKEAYTLKRDLDLTNRMQTLIKEYDYEIESETAAASPTSFRTTGTLNFSTTGRLR